MAILNHIMLHINRRRTLRVALKGSNLFQSNLVRPKFRTSLFIVAHFPGKFEIVAFPNRTRERFELSREMSHYTLESSDPWLVSIAGKIMLAFARQIFLIVRINFSRQHTNRWRGILSCFLKSEANKYYRIYCCIIYH